MKNVDNNLLGDLNLFSENDYCKENCEYLSFTEKEQNDLGKEGKKIIHQCKYFSRRVYHYTSHPKLIKIPRCPHDKPLLSLRRVAQTLYLKHDNKH